MKLKIASILFYTLLILTIVGGTCGIIWEVLPDRSLIPDSLFNTVVLSQFVILPGLLITGFLVNKWKK